jgi:hypothetical protein
MWLVEHSICWTTDRLAKCGMDHLEHWPLCDQHEESINHLLVYCAFARQVWTALLGLSVFTSWYHNQTRLPFKCSGISLVSRCKVNIDEVSIR